MAEKITIQISFENDVMAFKMNPEKPLVKAFRAFAEGRNVDHNSLRFTFNGARVRAEQSPAELEMEEGDEIQAHMFQQGGVVIIW